MVNKQKTSSVPAVDRMLDIVEFLSKHQSSYGINELARELELPVNSVFRILKCLEDRRYVEVREDGGYQLGTGFFGLGMALQSKFELRKRGRRHIEHLCRQTGETCQIHIPDDDRMLVLDVATPDKPFFMQIMPGSRFLYHPNAFGKAVLAFLDKAELDIALKGKLERKTENTITDKKKLKNELDEIRETGLSYDREEYVKGHYCIGAPVFDSSGEVCAGLGVSGLVSRFDPGFKKKAEQEILGCAKNLSRDIGYAGDMYERFRR